MQKALAEAQIAEAQGKAAKLMAESELTKKRVDEMLANIENIVADTVSKRMDTAFVALQAGGVATTNPLVAPAGDELLRSVGWTDATPDPSIAQLNSEPVQQARAQAQLEPVMPGGSQPTTSEPVPAAAIAADQLPPSSGAPSGMQGARQGIETTRIEQ